MGVKLSQVKAKATSKLTKTCIIVSICCFVFFLIGIGSGLYSASVLNKPTPTPVAVEHFKHLYEVEGSLENEIKGKVVPKVKDIADDTVQIVNEMVSRLVRHERSIGSKSLSKSNKKYWKKTLKKIGRPRREASSHFAPNNLDPIQHTEREAPLVTDDGYVRAKRKALEDLRQDLDKCRKVQGNDCRRIYEKMTELTKEIDQRFAKMMMIVNEMRPKNESEIVESEFDERKEAKRKMKEEKKRRKEEMKQKLLEQGLRDCSSEEFEDGGARNMSGCAVNMKDVFENDTNIIHTKTKIYAKPSTIVVSSSTEPQVTKLDTQSTTSTLEIPTLPSDTIIEPSNTKSRALFNNIPHGYRSRYGHYTGHQPPPNEDLDSHLTYNKFTKTNPDGFYRDPLLSSTFMDHNNLDDYVEIPAIVQAEIEKPPPTTTSTTPAPRQPKIMGASGTLLSVCEQFARQNPTGTILSNNGNFQARPISSVGQQQLPQTGQSSKASAQLFVNPGFNQMGAPLCYMSQFNPSPMNQWYGNYYGHSSPQFMGRPGVPFSQGPGPFQGNWNYGRSLMPSGPSQGNYYCAFMPQANHQIPGGFGAFRTSEAIASQEGSSTEHTNIPSESDIIYASFTNKPVQNMTEFQQRSSVKCQPGTIACAGTGQCIETSKWCDSRINCLDSSDEVACSCKARLPAIRICDGVIDCPLGDDEKGCNGCDKYSFTCYNSRDEFDAAHGATTSMCYTINDRCDGIWNCINGKDEKDCNVIVKNIGGYLSHQVSYSDGFLYRNFKGKWYPVCRNPQSWAKSACDAEVGHTPEPPRITKDPNSGIIGPFISNKGDKLQDPIIEEHCDAPTYVTCPQIKCGLVKNPHDPIHPMHKRHSSSDNLTEKERVSIVGGTDCYPHQWPFIVAIFKNGHHHCGGAIKSAQWIITAAHCFHSHYKSYYEVRAGALRHRSYNPEVQISPIIKVFVYPKYDQKAMVEDLALVKIASPLNFNRYVRPICLPGPGRSGSVGNWIQGPPVGQICTVMGWGTIAEDGPHPDGLKEVHLPILPTCKNNNRGKAICAGEVAGGRDACQGDSGGPLLCKSLGNPAEWYLAGVVSHGEGCARENTAGIYTRISLYLDWLDRTEHEDGEPGSYPIPTCTGFKCIWGGGKCLPRKSRCNGVVECLGGEDEVDCQFNAQQLRSLERSQFKADETTTTTTITTTMEVTTVIDTTLAPPPPSTTIETTTIETTSTSTTTESTTTEEEEKTKPSETTQTSTTTTTTTTEPSPIPTTLTTEEASTTPITRTTTTNPSMVSSSTSRDGRQLDLATKATTPEPTTKATNDSGRHLFDLFSSSTTHKPTISTTKGFVPIRIDATTPKKPIINALTVDGNKGESFHCKNIPQAINQIHRCDKQTDCEDGTDELNCTCKEFLIHQQSHKICDGIVDCVDLTDEEGCLNCAPNEFKCRLSKTCVSLSSRCDKIVDCLHKEDELDCITLTNGTTVLVTPDYNPVLKSRGILTHNHRGNWTIHCDSSQNNDGITELVGQTCISLGFAGYARFENVKIDDTGDLNIQIVPDTTHDTRKTIAQERVSLVNMKENMVDVESVAASSDCVALWIECVPHTSSNKTNVIRPVSAHIPAGPDLVPRPVVMTNTVPHVVVPLPDKGVKVNDTIGLSEYQWPFSAVIFADGKPICNGILVARQWVIVESSCLRLYKFEIDHIAVLLGNSNSYLHIQGPYEVVARADCVREVPNANVILVHLDYPVYYNRYILPTYLIDSSDREVETNECLTVSIDKFGRLRSWPVKKRHAGCPTGYKCFEQLDQNSTTLCELKDYIFRSGYVMCRTESSSWFPTGFYHSLHGICSPDKILTVLSLNPRHFQLLNVIETLECQQFYSAPLCHGHRCPFGVCLPEQHICDGVVDCHDASDEAAQLCVGRKKRKCDHDEIRCRNGNCVEKTRFCDTFNDCGDYTDEPKTCSCFEYLKMTDPNKICDGVRNCYDKSDELNEECRCSFDKFRCGETLKCIPLDFVCDSQNDCPGGEDEMYCYGIQNNHYSDGYHEVMQQEFGIWHTKCFPKSKPPTEADLIEICKKMGYIDPKYPKARARVDNDTVMAILPTSSSSSPSKMELIKENDEVRVLPKPTKAAIYNSFSTLAVNDGIKFYMKPSRPLAKLVEWDENDHKNCFRIEINCD